MMQVQLPRCETVFRTVNLRIPIQITLKVRKYFWAKKKAVQLADGSAIRRMQKNDNKINVILYINITNFEKNM